MNKPIFREKALERLASPENLHELVPLVTIKSWLAWGFLAFLLLGLGIWAFWGEIPKTVKGKGILIQSGGVTDIIVTNNGFIDKILVKEGQNIKLGDTLAIVITPEIQQQIQNIKYKIIDIENKKNKLDAKETQKITAFENLINQQKSELKELENKLATSAYIRSNYQGKIIEITTKKGQIVESGNSLMSVELLEDKNIPELEALIYISSEEGKKITQGMHVRIAPSTIKTEEHGYLTGKVLQVSEYPATRQGMLRVLGNAELVQTFSQNGAPTAVIVKLEKANNPSGFNWTASNAPKTEIKSGTLCEAFIVTAKQKPIELLKGD
jgi:HlyD family secretion protein